MLDLYPADGSDPAENYRTIRRELEAFSGKLAVKEEIVAANKIDLAVDDGAAFEKLKAELADKEVHAISGASHKGVAELLQRLWKLLHPEAE
jgi:GTP-binding protein